MPVPSLMSVFNKFIPTAKAAGPVTPPVKQASSYNVATDLKADLPKFGNPIEQLKLKERANEFKKTGGYLPPIAKAFSELPNQLAENVRVGGKRLGDYNPLAQIQAMRNMTPAQKDNYRIRADEVVNPFKPMQGAPRNFAENIAQGIVNSPANGVAAGAKIAAARNPWEAGGDALQIGGLVSLLLGLAPSNFAGAGAGTSAKEAVKMVGQPMGPQAAQAVGRPAHQALIEQAYNQGNLAKVAELIKQMPNDAYKQPMITLFGPILKGAGIVL